MKNGLRRVRAYRAHTLFAGLFAFLSHAALAAPLSCDVVIVDGSLGGVAAALQSARMGMKTCLTTMTDWLGGQMSVQGVSPIDTPNFPAQGGRTVDDFITLSLQSMRPVLDVIRAENPGCAQWVNWVSEWSFTPQEADRAIKQVLGEYKKNLTIFYETVPKKVIRNAKGEIKEIQFIRRHYKEKGAKPYSVFLSKEISDWYDSKPSRRYSKSKLALKGKVFIDASETGEILVLSGARYRLGSETPEDPNCLSGFVMPALIAKGKASAADLAWLDMKLDGFKDPQPADFNPGAYHILPVTSAHKSDYKSVFDYRRICGPKDNPNDPPTSVFNWGDPAGNDFYAENLILPPDALKAQIENWQGGLNLKALHDSELHSLRMVRQMSDFVHLVHNSKDPLNSFGTGTGLSKFPYIRETRRMEGVNGYFISGSDIEYDPKQGPEKSMTHFSDSVGIGQYVFDSRSCPNPNYHSHFHGKSKLYQIPLRALISSNVPNLLSANKTLAVSKEAETAYRLHPTEWNIGIGAGSTAAVAIQSKLGLHELEGNPEKIKSIQKAIKELASGEVSW